VKCGLHYRPFSIVFTHSARAHVYFICELFYVLYLCAHPTLKNSLKTYCIFCQSIFISCTCIVIIIVIVLLRKKTCCACASFYILLKRSQVSPTNQVSLLFLIPITHMLYTPIFGFITKKTQKKDKIFLYRISIFECFV